MEGSDDGEVSNHVDLVELLVDHEAKDAHHGGTAIVELDATLAELGLLVKGVPAEIDETITEVTGEVAGGGSIGGVLHDEELEDANEEDELSKSGLGDGIIAEEGGEAIGVGVEGVALEVDVSREVKSGTGHDLAEEGELRNAAVLDLNVPEALELLLRSIVEEAKGIVEAEGLLGADLALEGVEGGGGLADLGRGEGGGGAGKEGSNGELHFE
uniref:Uncharacterized protein n=1 Tax=Odontella aurita TaxID=265563 RepID=A0A7S4JCC4_9STRA|mmetsp:Transcript_43634/g.132810  ORF Transcript_43634/g.132810 Transcript_43634/m.132810 type:complete len:214 (+) Transcript_43634:294-935(+)